LKIEVKRIGITAPFSKEKLGEHSVIPERPGGQYPLKILLLFVSYF
jgi:hypothetical protein